MSAVLNKLVSIFETKLQDNHLIELLRGSSVAFSLRLIGLATAYLFTLLITRNFGAEAMGIFALCFTVLQISAVVGKLGLDSALLRFVAEYTAQAKKVLVKEVYIKAVKIAVPSSLFLSLILYFSAPHIAKYVFHKEPLAIYLRLVSFAILPLVMISIHSQGLRGIKKIREFSFLQNVAVSLFAAAILGVSLLISRAGYIPLLAYIIGLFVVALLSLVMWLRHSRLNLIGHEYTFKLKTILDVAIPMLLAGSMFLVMQWTDTVMLGMFRAEEEVGIYAVSLKVATLTSVALFAINSIAAPKFAEFYGRNDFEGLGLVARQSTKLIFWTSFPVLLIFFLFPSPILSIFGTEFRAGVTALLILTFGQFVNSISGSVGYILQMTGKQKVFQNIILTATVINIFLNAVLIPRYGINGAAIASVVSLIFWNMGSIYHIKKSYNFYTIYLPVNIKKG